MKKLLLILILFMTAGTFTQAQSPQGKSFGFGIIVGDPTGLTMKVWTNKENAWVFAVGASYFGAPRIGVDYLWHFDAFNSNIVELYAGPGGVIGIGGGKGFWYKDRFVRTGNELGLGVRGVFGVNVVPQNTPLEIFFEIGALIAMAPDFGSAADVALGMRFYP